MLKMVLATIGIIATMAAAQTSAIWDGTADTDWYNKSPREQTEFTITTAEELAGFARLVSNGNDFSGLTIILGANIILNDTTGWQDWSETIAPRNSWLEIGTHNNRFNGIFDGNGFIVSGIYINHQWGVRGLFGNVYRNGIIRNLGVVASFVRSDVGCCIGGLVGWNVGKIENSYVIANTIITNEWNVGVLAGVNHGTIENSYAMGSATGRSSGTLVGTTHGTIRNSYAVGGDRLATPAGSGSSITINSHHLTTPAEQSTFIDWDFENVWGINANINNGYPYLRSFVDVRVDWGEQTTFTFNGEEQAPTATASFVSNSSRKVPIRISGATNVGTHTAKAVLETANPNINLLNDSIRFTINKREVWVEWEDKREFVFNRTVQNPQWNIKDDVLDRNIFTLSHHNSAAGVYENDKALELQVRQAHWTEFSRNNELKNSIIGYKILPRELTARLRNTSRERPVGLTKEQLDSILAIEIDFENFAEDSDGKDDKSTLGRLTFDIRKQDGNSQRSLRSQDTLDFGYYIVEKINPTSTNYIVRQEIGITISERFLILEEYPRATAISDAKKSDNRYGIKFAVNPVSEKAEISIVLPENAQATETNVVIYDMTGNVVASTTSAGSVTTATGGAIVWDLRNSAGRFVANGTYLVIAEVRCRSGRVYQYSARLGVNR